MSFEACCREFFSSRRKVYIQDRFKVVCIDHHGFLELPHVKGVAVRVLVSNYNVHWLLRVPADRGGLVLQVDLLEC